MWLDRIELGKRGEPGDGLPPAEEEAMGRGRRALQRAVCAQAAEPFDALVRELDK